MKVAIKIALLLLVVGYLIFAIVEFSQRTEERVCEAIDIEITDSLEGGFVTADYIHGILTKNKVFAEGKKLSSIDIQGLEETLQKDPYIDSARCYCSAASHLCIYIIPQRPSVICEQLPIVITFDMLLIPSSTVMIVRI